MEICYNSPRKPVHGVSEEPSKENAASGLCGHRTTASYNTELAPITYPEFVWVTWISSAGQSQRIFSNLAPNWMLYHLSVTIINILETTNS